MSPFLRFILIAFGILLLINVSFVLKRLIPIMRRHREAKHIERDLSVFSVEAEVVEINSERLNDLDTQFNVKLCYMVGYEKYYKDIVLLNRHSLRMGQKFNLLCDEGDPANATLQDGSETDSTGNLIFNLCLDIVLLIIDTALNCLEIFLEAD